MNICKQDCVEVGQYKGSRNNEDGEREGFDRRFVVFADKSGAVIELIDGKISYCAVYLPGEWRTLQPEEGTGFWVDSLHPEDDFNKVAPEVQAIMDKLAA